jgi:hypothetical protein
LKLELKKLLLFRINGIMKYQYSLILLLLLLLIEINNSQ